MSRSPAPERPKKPGQGAAREWWSVFRSRVTLPPLGRLAVQSLLAILIIGTLVLLLKVSAGGFNRFGLQQIAGGAAKAERVNGPPAYIRR